LDGENLIKNINKNRWIDNNLSVVNFSKKI
jgi:hypothetical protein